MKIDAPHGISLVACSTPPMKTKIFKFILVTACSKMMAHSGCLIKANAKVSDCHVVVVEGEAFLFCEKQINAQRCGDEK